MQSPKVRVSSFTDVITGGTPSTMVSDYWANGIIPWLNSGDLNNGEINNANNFITELGLKNSAAKLMPPGTVLIALTGATTGVTAILNIEACANQSVTGILPSDKHNSKYLYYYLKAQRKKILSKCWGGAQPHINQKFIKDFLVPLPPISEQRHVAKMLSKAEFLIAQRKESIRLLDEFLKSTFVMNFIDKNLPLQRLDTLCNKITDGEHLKPEYLSEGYPFISVVNITNGFLDFDNCKYVSNENFLKFSKRCKPEIGDILYTKVGATYGRAAIVDIDRPFSLYVSVALLKPNREKVNPVFLKYAINHPFVKRQADKSIKGAGVPDLHLVEIKSFKIPLPARKAQDEFGELVAKIDSIKSQFNESLTELENLYGSLSQKAFKGELREA
jgi:type I restriction enzyme S subunit